MYLYNSNKLDEFKPVDFCSHSYGTEYAFNFLFYCNVILRGYYKSYETVYIFMKKRKTNLKVNYLRVFVNCLFNLFIKFITGFNKYIIIDSYRWSRRLHNAYSWKIFRRNLVGGIISLNVIGSYAYIDTYKIYKSNNGIWNFNPDINRYISHDMVPLCRRLIDNSYGLKFQIYRRN